MKQAKVEMRTEYKREDLGKGARGKYFARFKKGTNLVLLNDKVAAAFPNAEAVNEALLDLLTLAKKTGVMRSSSGRAVRKRVAA